MEKVIARFIELKEYKHQLTKKPLSKNYRMDEMLSIVKNEIYGSNYTKEERLLAVDFIKEIVKED